MKKRLDKKAVRSKIGGILISTSYESTFIAIYMMLGTFSICKYLASALYKEGEIQAKEPKENRIFLLIFHFILSCYFGGARSKGFATLRNVSKLQFFDKIGQAKSVGFRLYSAI